MNRSIYILSVVVLLSSISSAAKPPNFVLVYRNVFDVLSHVQRPDGYDDEVNMAEMLKASGKNYVTSMFGKGCSTMGRFDEAGYDVTDEIPGEIGGNGNAHGSYWDVKKKTPFPADNPKRIHSLRKDSVAFVNEYAGKQPFFMMVSHYAAHIPHLATKEAFDRNKKRWIAEGRDTEKIDVEKSSVHRDIIYAAMIEEMDTNVGALIDALQAKNELDNTYIIFTSDNGGGHSERREVEGEKRRFNGPLQEGKRSIYEGGIRVPTIISGPGIKAGSHCDVPIVQWDFLPTFHDLSGSEAPLPEGIDGGSLRDVFARGNEGTVERGAPGIVHHYPCHYHPPISSIIIGDYKLMRHLNSGEIKLFNIKTDYREQHDLSTEMPEKVESMDAIRAKYVQEVDGGTAEQVREALYDLMDNFKDHGYDVTDFNHRNPNGNGHGDWWEPADKTPIPLDDPKRVFSLAKTAGDFLKERAKDKKPFYMMVSHYAVHVRNTSLKSTREKYLRILSEEHGIAGGVPDISRFDKNADEMPMNLRSIWERANYAAMMENMDSSIGMVLDELKAHGMEENTYVIFSSDNGGGQSNAPLQGGKAKMWEGGLRIPMFVAGPGIAANSQCDKPVAQWDYLTTMHDLVGSTAALPHDLDGVSLRPVLEQGNDGKLAKRDTGLVFHFPAHYTVPITSYRDGDFKLMRHLNTGEIKLFNVVEDMGESNDLSKTMPEKTADMVRRLDAYLEKVGAWKMDEVYAARSEELEKWITDDKEKSAKINQRLKNTNQDSGDRKKLQSELKSAQSRQTKHRSNLDKLNHDRKSTRWF